MDVKINNPEQIPRTDCAGRHRHDGTGGRTHGQEISIRRTGKPDEYGILPVFVPCALPAHPPDHRLSGGNVRPLSTMPNGQKNRIA